MYPGRVGIRVGPSGVVVDSGSCTPAIFDDCCWLVGSIANHLGFVDVIPPLSTLVPFLAKKLSTLFLAPVDVIPVDVIPPSHFTALDKKIYPQ